MATTQRDSNWLLSKGFEEIGQWKMNQASAQFDFECEASIVPGVYAFAVDCNVRYVGSTNNLMRRLNNYKRRVARLDSRLLEAEASLPSDEQATIKEETERLVRKEIRKALREGQAIQILAFAPKSEDREIVDFDGMFLDVVAGLEIGLIRQLQPLWNIRGRAISSNSDC